MDEPVCHDSERSWLVRRFGEEAMVFLDQADTISRQMLGGGVALAGGALASIGITILPWLVGPGIAVLLVLFAQRAIVFAPDKIIPKIVEGRVNAFYKEACLLEQQSITEDKKTVGQLAQAAGVTIVRFVRFVVGG